MAAGPLIGGLLTTYASWRWVFAGEVFIVLIILGLTRRIADTPPEQGARLDVVGTVLSALGLGLVVYGILRSGTWGFVQPKAGGPAWLGLSPVIWLILSGGVVLRVFLWWENHRLARGNAALLDPAMLRNPTLRGRLVSFFFQYFLQSGLFFAVPARCHRTDRAVRQPPDPGPAAVCACERAGSLIVTHARRTRSGPLVCRASLTSAAGMRCPWCCGRPHLDAPPQRFTPRGDGRARSLSFVLLALTAACRADP